MATDEEVLEKSICQINFDEDEEEVLPRYMYRYTLYWEHLYFALNGKQLIGRSGMYRNKLILQPKPLTLGLQGKNNSPWRFVLLQNQPVQPLAR